MFIAVLFTISQKEEAQVSTDRRMDKQNMVQTCNVVVFSLPKEADLTCSTT